MSIERIKEIKRFGINYRNEFPHLWSIEDDDGPYVIYSDHKAALAAAEERVKELEHNNAHLKYGLEDAGIDSSAIEAGQCIYLIMLEKAGKQISTLEKELKWWKTPFDKGLLDAVKEQASHKDSLAAQGIYINALEHEVKHLEASLRGVQKVYDENVDDIAVNGIDEELKYTFWAAIAAASTPKKGE